MTAPAEPPRLERRLGLVQATALNMTNMIGIGPFITIPILMSSLNGGGPQAMIGWLVAILVTIPDGMIWSELGAAMPGTGGSYGYLREGFGRETWGRMVAFLFIWQFILSGPLEIASGYIGFSQYLTFLWPGMTPLEGKLVMAALGLIVILLLYRSIASVGTLSVVLWVVTLVTVAAVIVTGAIHFSAKRAFDFPPGAFQFSWGALLGLGAASRVGIYDYLGYYNICYLGEEVKDPGRVIPRSITISLVGVALIYLAVNFSIIGVVPWREFVPAGDPPAPVASALMNRIYGHPTAAVFTVLVLATALGSVFALLLGYSRIPYAAAQDGTFFKVFGRVHGEKHFPHVSLVVMGLISIVCTLLPLGAVIDALLTTRILVQFIGQIVAVTLLRRRAPQMERPYRIWLYPIPALLALVGWVFVFATNDGRTLLLGLGSLVLGLIFFLIWSRATRRWPFAVRPG
ncbi:MAG: APC family permease [Planctomycetes bacterium]|nr:APC family permease [Planctomycetota bacterium]